MGNTMKTHTMVCNRDIGNVKSQCIKGAMYIFPYHLFMLLLRLQTKCLLQIVSFIHIGTIPTPCATVQMHLSRDSDSTAGEPEDRALGGVDT
jgi:hypothetical protein